MKKSHSLVLTLSALIAATSGIWLGQIFTDNTDISIKPATIQGAIYPNAKVIKNFELIDQLSNKVTKSGFFGHWSLIFVGYTHCPDICPTTLAVMDQVDEFMSQQQIQPPNIVFLSIDPERDTPQKLKSYVSYFNKKFIALTGSLSEITKVTQQLNAVFRKAPGMSGEISEKDYLMDHSSALMLINPDGNLQSILTAPHTPANIIESIINSQTYYESKQK